MHHSVKITGFVAAILLSAGCTTPQDDASGTEGAAGTSADANATTSADTNTSTGADTGTGATAGGGASAGTGTSIPSLVNVNLQNVLNDLSVSLKIDKANIPVNAQVPIEVAANVCGVSVNVLSVSTGGQASCTAKTASPQLVQVVQQQISAGGNVGGGAQTTTTPTNNMM
jgi:hypothetical protein